MALRIMYRGILPGEAIPPYLRSQRYAMVPTSEERDDFEWAETQWSRMSWALPTGIARVCRYLGLPPEAAQSMLDFNTLVPGLGRFIPAEAKQRLIEHHLYQSVRGVSGMCGLSNAHQTNVDAWRPAFCKSCLAKDVTPDGDSFWRIQFVLSASTYCAWHEEVLQSNCRACGAAARSSLMSNSPSLMCICGRPRVPVIEVLSSAQEEVELEFSKAWTMLLDSSALLTLQYETVLHLIQNQLTNLGVFRCGRTDWQTWDDLNAETPYAAKMNRLGIYPTPRCTLGQIKRGVLPRKVAQMVLLLLALFDGWKNVVRAISVPKMVSEDPNLAVVPPAQDAAYRRTYRRRIEAETMGRAVEIGVKYQRLRERYPRKTHAELKARVTRAESKFLTLGRLKELGIESAPLRDNSQRFAKLDKSLARHIRARATALRKSGFQGRLSSAKLRQGFRYISDYRSLLARGMLPMTKEALCMCEETAEAYRRRLLKLNIANGLVNEVSVGNECAVDALVDSEVRRLNGCATSRRRWQSNSAR